MTTELPKSYDPSQVEPRWYRHWMEQGYFHADAAAPKAPFTIVIPPPNVTGSLHMGHALTTAIQDTLVRWRRMQGYNALWLPGTDHAGIATQLVVERMLLRTEGKSRHDLGREEFLARIWKWKEENGGRIIEQLQALGASCDWDRLRFTMDEGLSRAVREAFVRLHEQGLIYRARRLINWCSACRTAISDLEVEHAEVDGSLWHIAYPVTGSSERLVVATTRPETLLGDTAVAVHPEDDRFKHLIGRTVDLPLTGRAIPIIGDAILVDREFGTGAVKVTPGHDFNDFETGQRHGLPQLTILDLEGRLIDPAPAAYRGLTVAEGRERVLADLGAAGLLVKTEPHKLSVGRCQRSDTVVEPMLSLQWFVQTPPLAAPAIAAVTDGRTRIVPELWTKTYMNWMTGIKDWCISRQLWWGHRIPAWFCDACGEVHVAREAPTACGKCGGAALRQDEDVLDTWFSSALWPFSTLGWPDATRELRTFYPTSVMETGSDILFFWVARMMMMGMRFMDGEVPFRTVFLHAMVVDENGEKMSKVKGNVIDPLDLISGATAASLVDKARRAGAPEGAIKNIQKQFPDGMTATGADALRFTLAAMAAQGRNIRLALGRIEGYRHFANKIWNAARFALMHLEGFDADRFADELGGARGRLSLADRYILSRLQRTAAEVDAALEGFKLNDAASALYRFIWSELCDWYIELAKPALYGGRAEGATAEAAEARRLTQGTLALCLKTACELLHPFMPFITEEVWQHLPRPAGTPQSIMITIYPSADASLVDEEAEQAVGLLQEVIVAVRNLRAEFNVGPSVELPVTLIAGDAALRGRLEAQQALMREFGRLGELTIVSAGEHPHGSVASLVAGGQVQVCVHLAGQVDAAAELVRLGRERAKAEKDLEAVQRKLGDENFLARAPREVREKEERRLAENRERIARIGAQEARLKAL